MVFGENGRTAEDLYAGSGWTELARTADPNFIVFYLEPEEDGWRIDEPYGCPDGDVAYVEAVFASASENTHYCIHETKMYLAGIGDGGTIAQMAAMFHTVIYSGLLSVCAPDVSEEFFRRCGRDWCQDLFSFTDPTHHLNMHKGDIPLPVWIIDDACDDFRRSVSNRGLAWWIAANGTEQKPEEGEDHVLRYVRSEKMPYPADQQKEACTVWCCRPDVVAKSSGQKPAFAESGEFCRSHSLKDEREVTASDWCMIDIEKIWAGFLMQHQRWISEPGGSLRMRLTMKNLPEITYYNEEIGGWMREWYVYVPQSVREQSAETDYQRYVPVVFALHGYTCNGEIYAGNTGWCDVAEENGFIAVFPSAVPGRLDFDSDYTNRNNMDLPAWNFLHDIPDGPDELQFFEIMLEKLSETWPVDRSRVYVTGHSHGSQMTQVLGLAKPELFAAIAPCSGVIFEMLYDAFAALPELKGELPMPVWMFVGTEEGTLIDAMPAPDNATGRTIEWWHRVNRLQGDPKETYQKPFPVYTGRWQDLVYRNEEGEDLVRFTRVDDFPHGTMPSMSKRIWDEFFSHHRREGN